MRSRWLHAPYLHSPALGLPKRATWLELFYDLVFVAAFIQLGNGLAGDVSVSAVRTFAGTFLELWVAWTGFTFFVNRFTVDDFLHRSLVLVQMFAVAGMALAAPFALQGRPEALAVSTGVAQLLVSAMHLRAYVQVPEARDYARYWTLVFGVAGLGWLVSSVVPHGVGAWLCAVSTAAVLVAPLSERSRVMTERLPIDFEHLGERYGLLTIIVLGESFVKVLGALAADTHGASLYVAGSEVLLLTCGIWWVYFDGVAGSEVRSGRGQWIVWLYGHIPLQLGIVLFGVAIKHALHFAWNEPAEDRYRYLLAGSLALVYFAVAALDSVTERRQAELSDRARVNARAVSGLFLLVLAPAGHAMSAVTFLGLVTAINVAQVAFDMMLAPMADDPHATLGARTTSELARERIATGQGSAARAVDPSKAIRKGAPSALRRDLYFYLIEGSFWRMAAVLGSLFVLLNVFFAALYQLQPGSITGVRDGRLLDAFFFSVQTMSTIGYGTMSPSSLWGHVVVTIEAATGLVGVAVVTGLVFAKLSRPRAAVLFSKSLVVTTLDGKPVLMFRAGNARGNDVVDAQMTFTALMDELSAEGQHLRRMRDLALVRSRSPMFTLSWTLIHELDERSPLRDVDWTAPGKSVGSFIVTMMGHDSTYAQTTYARHTYGPGDVRLGHRFVDVIHRLPDGRTMVDYDNFHETLVAEERVRPPRPAD